MSATQLRITEVFHSLQGEAQSAGLPTVFVRLTGCPLRCQYCDTEYAFYGGERRSLNKVLDQVAQYACERVCVTGGEPLAQPACHDLLSALSDAGYRVSLETSGAMDVSAVDSRVSIVMDLKTPSSGEVGKNLYANIDRLARKDQVKFVLCDRADFDWAIFKVDEYRLCERVGEVLFSPSFEQLEPAQLAEWVLASGRALRFQIQLHKLLWGEKAGV